MTSISSVSSATTTASVSNGLGGLVSGMDVDSLVEQLTISGQEKIDYQQQSLQKLEWKQTAYREITTALAEFKSTYFDTLSSTNLRSTSFFNTATATSSSDAVTATATSNAVAGSITIESISQLATNATLSGSSTVSKALSGSLTDTGTLTEEEITTLLSELEGKSISLSLDGKTRTISFDSTFTAAAGTTAESLEAAFQDALDDAFGKSSTGESLMTASITGNSLSFSSSSSTIIVSGGTAVLETLGFTNSQSNRISAASALSALSLSTALEGETFEFTINDVDFSFSGSSTLDDIIREINGSEAGVTLKYTSLSDKFTLTADETGSGDNIRISQATGNLLTALFGSDSFTEVEGINAELIIDGQSVVRSSNAFTLDGVKIVLKDTTEAGDAPITIGVEADSTKLLDTVKKFVEDYNTLVDRINTLLKERADSDYPPLTDAQREDMSEEEIEKWETKAKAGLLANDSTLRSIVNNLQQIMFSSGTGALSLYDIGITSAGYAENGKLQINEDKLKDALASKSFDIMELFTDTNNGLANNINTILNNAIETKGVRGSRGSLVELAGVASTTSDTQNSIFDQIETINERIEDLKERLEAEQDRWWTKFTAMETALSALNSQSAMLANMLSS